MPHTWEHLINPEVVLRAYIATALWATNDESDPSGGVPLDENYTPEDMDEESVRKMRDDIIAFLDQVGDEDIEGYLTGQRFIGGIGDRRIPSGEAFQRQTPQNMGTDFFLTRCGHGTGFWDRGIGELGDRLTEISEEFGDQHLYVGDDEKIYAS